MKIPTVLKVFGIVLMLLCLVFYINRISQQEIHEQGIENIGIVRSVNNIRYMDNEKSMENISVFNIVIDYNYEGNSYSKLFELERAAYEQKFDKDLQAGDTIHLIHLPDEPLKVLLR